MKRMPTSRVLILGILLIFEISAVQGLAEEQRRPILIPDLQEPEEMRVEPRHVNDVVLTPPEQMLADAMKTSDRSSPAALLPALNRILAQYPDFSDGYPRSRHDPKILWVDDAEIVGDRITKVRPIPGTFSRRKLSVASANWAQVA